MSAMTKAGRLVSNCAALIAYGTKNTEALWCGRQLPHPSKREEWSPHSFQGYRRAANR